MQEYETSAYVVERLRALQVESIRTGIANTGVTALIHGRKPGDGASKVALVRADMDALPILEENDVEYKSLSPGAMHACGHDAHTAMLLGVARILLDRRDQFSGTVKLLFQPAEEGPGGAKPMIEQGVLENPHVDAVFGLHVAQDLELGKIEVRPGPAMASSDRFNVIIQGKGGHGASPHLAVDPVMVAAYAVTTLQTIVSREVDPVDPAVVTVGKIQAGQANNVIPDTAELRGTVRSFNPERRQMLARRVQDVITGVAESFGASAQVEYQFGYPATINNPEMTDLVIEAARGVVGEDNVLIADLQMGAEDFSYFLQERPGCFFFVGTRNEERGLTWGHHHPRFDIDEDGMAIGMQVMASSVMRYLNGM
jgi:amidohydrolase